MFKKNFLQSNTKSVKKLSNSFIYFINNFSIQAFCFNVVSVATNILIFFFFRNSKILKKMCSHIKKTISISIWIAYIGNIFNASLLFHLKLIRYHIFAPSCDITFLQIYVNINANSLNSMFKEIIRVMNCWAYMKTKNCWIITGKCKVSWGYYTKC